MQWIQFFGCLVAAVLLLASDFGSIDDGCGYCGFGGGIGRDRFEFVGCLTAALLAVSDSGGISDGYLQRI